VNCPQCLRPRRQMLRTRQSASGQLQPCALKNMLRCTRSIPPHERRRTWSDRRQAFHARRSELERPRSLNVGVWEVNSLPRLPHDERSGLAGTLSHPGHVVGSSRQGRVVRRGGHRCHFLKLRNQGQTPQISRSQPIPNASGSPAVFSALRAMTWAM